MKLRYRSVPVGVVAVLALAALACLCPLSGLIPGGNDAVVVDDGGEVDTEFATRAPTDSSGGEVAVDTPANSDSADETLEALNGAVLPERDIVELAVRFLGVTEDEIQPPAPRTFEVGDTDVFWVDNSDTDEVTQVAAVLAYETDHVYMWVEEGYLVGESDLARSAERFENETYPITRSYFGEEASPGIDGDVHLHILHAAPMGSRVAGYFGSQSLYPVSIAPYSNEREMFFINITNTVPGDVFYDAVLAHEFQHMIHNKVDVNEESWVNEGLSDLSEILNGYGDLLTYTGAFSPNPDIQLTYWPPSSDTNRLAHYNAAVLYQAYFLERFGEDTLKALVRSEANGFDGYTEALREAAITDPATGEAIDGYDVFADWVVANYANDAALGDGRYVYTLVPNFEPVWAVESYSRLPAEGTDTVHQFGTDYIELPANGPLNVRFEGSQGIAIIPTDTHDTDGDSSTDDRTVWWSNRGDESNPRLTTTLDLTGVSSATLEYDVWYFTEENWDYGYLTISEDGGQTWVTVETPYTNTIDPHGNGYGNAYHGESRNQSGANGNGWLHESINMDAYAGQEIEVRFEMITDQAVNEPGMAIDNIRVDAVGFYDDAETDSGLWVSEGWVRHDNVLPQTFVVQVLVVGSDPTLARMELDANNQGELLVEPGPGARQVVLIVSGTTPHISELATYSYSVTSE